MRLVRTEYVKLTALFLFNYEKRGGRFFLSPLCHKEEQGMFSRLPFWIESAIVAYLRRKTKERYFQLSAKIRKVRQEKVVKK